MERASSVFSSSISYSPSARSIRAVACSRSTSQTISLATIGSYIGEISEPGPTPESTRTPGPGGLAVGADRAGGRGEVLGRVLGVDPALDRVAAQLDVVLGDRQRLAGGDADPLLDDVDPGHHLGHAVLDLHAGVHLEEEVLAVLEQALDRARRRCSRRRPPPRWRSCRSARAAPRRPPAPAPPRSASGGGAGASSRARRGGSRCRACRPAPGPRRGAGRAGSARGTRSRREKNFSPSRAAPSNASCELRSSSATRKPLPPPPPAALTATG